MKSRFVEGLGERLSAWSAGWWGWSWKRTVPGMGSVKLTEPGGDTLIHEVDFEKISQEDLVDFVVDENHRLRQEVRKLFRDSDNAMAKRLR